MSSENTAASNTCGGGQFNFQPDQGALDQLVSFFGFSRNAATRALFYTGNQNADDAANWLFENKDNKNLDTPLETDLLGTSDSSEDDDDFMTQEFYKMVFVVNMELQMGAGKIAAQVAHACLGIFRHLIEDELKAEALMAWTHQGEVKIVVRGDSTMQLEMLAGQAGSLTIDHYLVQDAGRTQVAPGSKTVLAIFGKVEEVDRVTASLKLL